jgi:hypothetical protein
MLEISSQQSDAMTPEKISKDSLERFLKAKKEFDEHMLGVDAKAVFCCYALNQTGIGSEGAGIPKHLAVERAAMWLFPLFERRGDSSDEAIDSAIKVLGNCQYAFMAHRMFPPDQLQYDELETSLLSDTEIVRGSAYHFQLVDKLNALFSPYDQTLAEKFGIGPVKAVQIAKLLVAQLEENVNSFKAEFHRFNDDAILKVAQHLQDKTSPEILATGKIMKRHLEYMKGDWIPSISQIEKRLGSITEDEWDAFRDLFGLTPDNISSISDPKKLQDKPVYFVSKDRLFATQITTSLDAIFAHYDEYLRSSELLQNKYGQTVSAWMEDSIHSFMLRVFPEESVLKNACFPDHSTPSSNRETDGLIKWGPIVIVLEAKGKRVDRDVIRLSKPGLRTTLKKNIQDSFAQSKEVIKALQTGKVIEFKERHSDKTISIDGNKVMRVMSISVTLQHLYGISTQLAVTQRINLFKDNTYPWSVSIDDLDVATEFLNSPESFLYYIERRTAHQGMGISLSADELNLLAHYLDNRLHPTHYEQREEILKNTGTNNMIWIDGGEERFDHYYTSIWYGARKEDLEKPTIDLPPLISKILNYLRDRGNDDSKWIAFALLSLSNQELKAVVEDLKRIRNHPKPTNGFNRKTLRFKDLTVVIMSYDSLPDERVVEQVTIRSAIEQYKAKSKIAVSLAFDLSRPDVITLASWQEMPWEYDQAFEDIIEEEKTHQKVLHVDKANGKIGRNDPCPCGSSAKFKKCCMDFIKIEYI